MKKRITSLLLAMTVLLGLMLTGTVNTYAESTFTTSKECIRVLKLYEGFNEKPYWDYTQYTVGYGTRCPDDMVDYYTKYGITEKEAEVLLQNHLVGVEHDINVKMIDKYGLKLKQNQFDALVMFSYNCGTAWVYETNGTFHNAIAKGATGNDLVRAFALWCSAGNKVQTHLLYRRFNEVHMYINGVYPTTKTPPDNYCYVLYDANGGTTSPRSQGYDSNLPATPFPVPVYEGYIFQGWFTEKTGGTKITALDASHDGMTLYAHWMDSEGNVPLPSAPAPENPLLVTVVEEQANIRSGPGAGYTLLGVATKGQQFAITETGYGTGYTWGKFEGGWIPLAFTNYETALKEQITAPVPPKVIGTVNVQDWLRIRSGPGESYAIVGYLKPKQQVEILEQKKANSQTWGKISNGWINLDYVILENETVSGGNTGGDSNTDTESTTPTVWTGKVTADELLIRSGPGTTYTVKGYLVEGTAVTITERVTNGTMEWGKIADGWICMNYVELDAAGEEDSSNSTPEAVTGTVNVQDLLRIRSGPGTSYEIVGYLEPQEKVTITEQQTVNGTVWGKISNGWISLDYVILDSLDSDDTTEQKTVATITASCLHVRRGPSTSYSIAGYLYYGEKVEILDTATDSNGGRWGKISTGWIHLGYAKFD